MASLDARTLENSTIAKVIGLAVVLRASVGRNEWVEIVDVARVAGLLLEPAPKSKTSSEAEKGNDYLLGKLRISIADGVHSSNTASANDDEGDEKHSAMYHIRGLGSCFAGLFKGFNHFDDNRGAADMSAFITSGSSNGDGFFSSGFTSSLITRSVRTLWGADYRIQPLGGV